MSEPSLKAPKEIALFKTSGVRWAVHFLLSAADFSARLWSKVRAAALFPEAVNLACHWSVEVKYPENILIGRGVVIGKAVTLGGKGGIVLEDHVRISKGVTIESAGLDFSGSPPYPHIAHKVVIQSGAWIGANAIILGGVTIGAGAIIGAGTVVSKSVDAGAIVVGARSRVIER